MANESPFPQSFLNELPQTILRVLAAEPNGLTYTKIVASVKELKPFTSENTNLGKKKLDKKYDATIADILHALVTINFVYKYSKKVYRVRDSVLNDDVFQSVVNNPISLIRRGRIAHNKATERQLTTLLATVDPMFFENIVLDLLCAMGYGSSHGRRQHVGGTGDNGVDGVISRDPLGFDSVYVQAKRFKPTKQVGSTLIRDFIGALDQINSKVNIHGINKGIFITTGQFSEAAIQTASEYRYGTIVLINGDDLVYLMREYGIGVRNKETFTVAEIDEKYFRLQGSE